MVCIYVCVWAAVASFNKSVNCCQKRDRKKRNDVEKDAERNKSVVCVIEKRDKETHAKRWAREDMRAEHRRKPTSIYIDCKKRGWVTFHVLQQIQQCCFNAHRGPNELKPRWPETFEKWIRSAGRPFICVKKKLEATQTTSGFQYKPAPLKPITCLYCREGFPSRHSSRPVDFPACPAHIPDLLLSLFHLTHPCCLHLCPPQHWTHPPPPYCCFFSTS